MTRHSTSAHGRRARSLVAALACLGLVAAACGGDDDDADTSDAPAEEPADDDADTSDAPAEEPADDAADEGDDMADEGDDMADEGDDMADEGDDTADEPAPDPEPVAGFDGETIKVGVMTALSGPAALIGVQLANGQKVYFDYLNAEVGGIAGKYPVEIVLEDHLYETSTSVQKYAQTKDEVVMYTQVMGTPVINALLPLLQEDNIIAMPASQDAFWVREQNLFPIIPPYQIDAINGAAYYLNEGGGSVDDTICAVIQNDPYGEAGLEGLEFAAENMGFEIAEVARYAQGDGDFTAQITQLANAECDMVWATALPTELGGLTGTAAQSGFAPRWIGQSPSWVDELSFGDLAPYLEENLWIVSLGREWGDPDSVDMTQMIERVAKYLPEQDPDYYFTFGYLQAWAAHQMLDIAVANGDLGRDGLVTAMNSLAVLDFGDLGPAYTFGPPEHRDPPRGSTIFEVDTEKPFALGSLVSLYTSPEAEAYIFE